MLSAVLQSCFVLLLCTYCVPVLVCTMSDPVTSDHADDDDDDDAHDTGVHVEKIMPSTSEVLHQTRTFFILQAFEATPKAYKFTYDILVILCSSTACQNVARRSCLR